jgi:tetratricopeptide (TPR) repeat protein
MCLDTARNGLKQAPNDVLLRGKMCRYAGIWFKRDPWALEGIRQALRVQPANAHLLDWHSLVEHASNRARQSQWLLEVAMPLLPDSRGAFLVANSYFEGGRYGDGVEYYKKAIALAPDEHEYRFAMGLCGTYLAEQLERTDLPGPAGVAAREQALDAFASAAESLVAAQRLDPSELGWAYDYHVRTATHNFTNLPSNPATLERVMLSQAVSTTLQPASRTFKWDKLAAPLIDTYRRLLRGLAREAVATDPDYELWLMVRLQFALADKALDEEGGNRDEILATLRLMRQWGHRSDYYRGAMAVYGVLLDAKPKDPPANKD